MPAPKPPVAFSFKKREVEFTSVIDPDTKQHLVTCDLCSKLCINRSIHPISQHRTIFQIVMGLNLGRQEKDLTQFQQLILIVMTKKQKKTSCRRYKSKYYYKILCSRICEISLHSSNLNSHCVALVGIATFPRPPYFHGKLQCTPPAISGN